MHQFDMGVYKDVEQFGCEMKFAVLPDFDILSFKQPLTALKKHGVENIYVEVFDTKSMSQHFKL